MTVDKRKKKLKNQINNTKCKNKNKNKKTQKTKKPKEINMGLSPMEKCMKFFFYLKSPHTLTICGDKKNKKNKKKQNFLVKFH